MSKNRIDRRYLWEKSERWWTACLKHWKEEDEATYTGSWFQMSDEGMEWTESREDGWNEARSEAIENWESNNMPAVNEKPIVWPGLLPGDANNWKCLGLNHLQRSKMGSSCTDWEWGDMYCVIICGKALYTEESMCCYQCIPLLSKFWLLCP